VLLFLTLTATTQTANAQSFSAPLPYGVGENPNGGTSGDFNGDGKPDLAIGNVLHNNVSILLNNGDGTFQSAVNYNADRNPEAVLTADFNGDGKLDLAVGNFFGNFGTGSISILLGNGNGTFQTKVDYSASSPIMLVTGDFNADGKLDLAAGSWTNNSASVLLGNGNGSFQPAIPYAAGTEPHGITTADFNADGKPDLALSNNVSQNVSILIGNGDGTFQSPLNSALGTNLSDLSARDLNGDGKQDLIVSTYSGSQVFVLLGLGNGSFQLPVGYTVGSSPSYFDIADFNGDGRIDVVVVNADSNSFSVLRGNSDGTFQSATTRLARMGSFSPVVGDFDTDGKPDLAVLSNVFDVVDVYLNSPSARPVSINATATVPATGILVGTFKDYDTTKTAASFTATVDWGDPTPSTIATVSANGSGGFNVNGSHTYAKEGSYLLTIHIADTSGNFASATSTVVVADAPLTATGKTFNAVKGLAYLGTVANFTDADPAGTVAEFSASINWGDGVTSLAMILVDGHGGFDVFGNHTYSNTGTFPVVVTINDVGGSTATANSTANVTGPTLQFELTDYFVAESGGSAQIRVVRMGDPTGAASVSYATSDPGSPSTCSPANGKASSRCDFTSAAGSLNFAAGETQKTFNVLISQDSFVEGPETIVLTLSNATGTAVLGSPSTATLTINDDATEPPTNPIDVSSNFVRQHYLDFLNREPDTGGLNFWIGEIENCTPKPQCTEIKRINVSAAFFLSIEFQETGYLVYRFYKTGFGNLTGKPVPVLLSDFLRGTQEIGRGVVVGTTGWEQVLENNKQAYALAYVQRPDFLTAYPNSLTAVQVVTQMNINAGGVLSMSEQASLVAVLGTTPADAAKRASVLRSVAEDSDLKSAELTKAFVLMQYFGYLRRNPNDPPETNLDFGGYNFWLDKLNQFNGNFVNAEMVKAFIVSSEYRQRFGP
jgi:hypothetical protein